MVDGVGLLCERRGIRGIRAVRRDDGEIKAYRAGE